MTGPAVERTDAGFTLVELLVAVMIEAIIVGALGMAFVGILKSTTSVNQSLSRSGDARIAAAYIVSDARNSSGPEVSLTTSTCADASPPVAGGSLVVQFGSSTTAALTGVSTANVVDYFLASNRLMRRECQNGVLVSDRVVASNVQGVAVSCSPTADCSGSPTSITVRITETTDTNGAAYVYSLTGTFRKLIGDGAPASGPPQSVILLGSGASCVSGASGLSMTTSAHITVYGTAVINNTDASSSCTAMRMTTSATFTAGSTKILQGGSCTATTSGVCPTTTSYTPAITDPFSSIAAPSAAALGLTAQSGCAGGVAQPGVYASTLSISVSNTCQLQPGVYILNNGLSVSTSAQLTSAAGGVLLYIAGGSFNSSTSATINISAQTTNAWAGIAIWQAKTDTNTLAFSTSGAVTIDGFIYAPKAAVNMSTSAANPTVKGIIAQNIIMSTSANLVIGTPPSITTASLANGEKSAAYSATVSGTGGNTPYTWSATGLPAGLTMNSSTGVISGTPTATGTSSVVAKLTEATGTQVTATLPLTIVAAPTISTASLPQGEKTAAYSTTLAATPGVAPYSWSATGLPAGLTMSSAGVISGTPTGTAGTATVAVSLSDALGGTASKSLSLVVINGPSITTASLPSGEKTAPYTTTTMAGSGGTAGYTWSSTGLPAGLSMSSAGVITGTPTGAAGTSSVTLTLTDSVGGTASTTLSLVVAAQPTITSVTLTNKASGGTAGKMEAGDQITIVYSAAMRVSSFCSSWTTGDAANQSLTGAGLMVNVTNGPGVTNDAITSITNSSGCLTFNVGSIDLGSNAYVSTAVTFGGISNTTIAWTASTRTLVITFGTAAGTVGASAVPATSPIYTAPATLVDSAGATLGNSPLTLTPAAVRF